MSAPLRPSGNFRFLFFRSFLLCFFQIEKLRDIAGGLVAGEIGLEGNQLVVLEHGDQLPVHTAQSSWMAGYSALME